MKKETTSFNRTWLFEAKSEESMSAAFSARYWYFLDRKDLTNVNTLWDKWKQQFYLEVQRFISTKLSKTNYPKKDPPWLLLGCVVLSEQRIGYTNMLFVPICWNLGCNEHSNIRPVRIIPDILELIFVCAIFKYS